MLFRCLPLALLLALSAGVCWSSEAVALGLARPRDAEKAQELADKALVRKDYDKAIAHYDKAIRLDPRFARAYHGRGVAYFHKGQYDKAVASYSQAIRLEPRNDVALFDRGLAHWYGGAPRQAVADFTEAVKVSPKNDSACNGLAWVLATTTEKKLRDGKRAVEWAKKACGLSAWKDPLHLSTLAAAYAESGDFKQAIRWHKKAMASPRFPPDKMARARERLKLYESGKPYREHKGKTWPGTPRPGKACAPACSNGLHRPPRGGPANIKTNEPCPRQACLRAC